VYLRAPPSEDEDVPVMLQLSIFIGKEEIEKIEEEEDEELIEVRFDSVKLREEGEAEKVKRGADKERREKWQAFILKDPVEPHKNKEEEEGIVMEEVCVVLQVSNSQVPLETESKLM
jgi:hypothetical protein